MESASISPQDHRALIGFQAQCLRTILNIKSTYYTKVLDPTATTFTHMQVIQQAQMPTITATIHKAQLKFLGHVLRTNHNSHPIALEGDIVFSRGMLYRGGVIGDKCRRGYPSEHWIDQVTKVAWNTLTTERHSITRDAISTPHSYLQLRLIAQDRHYWGHIVSVPTHIVADVKDHTVQFFSQTSQDSYECSA